MLVYLTFLFFIPIKMEKKTIVITDLAVANSVLEIRYDGLEHPAIYIIKNVQPSQLAEMINTMKSYDYSLGSIKKALEDAGLIEKRQKALDFITSLLDGTK